jgi:hypothetical protein
MVTKSVLISFAGYPFTPSSLMPDNGLAMLAASLLEQGNECTILDYGTVEVMERLSPGRYGDELFDISRKILHDLKSKGSHDPKDEKALRDLESIISGIQDDATDDLAKEIAGFVKQKGISLVGMKLWNGDGFFGSIRIAEEIRRQNPSAFLVGGGPQVDYFTGHIFDVTDVFDALVYGEGEETIRQLAAYVDGRGSLNSIPNVIFRDGKDVIRTQRKFIDDLDSLPTAIYDRDIYPAMQGDDKFRIITIDESRGCFYGKCNFCIQPFKSGARLRKRSPEKIVDDMELFIKAHGISVFRYAGSATPARHAKTIGEEILKRGLEVEYTMFCVAAGYSREDFGMLKKSGLHAVFFGGESGSAYQLKHAINKPTRPEQLRRSITAAKDAGIYTIASFIFPTPGETEKTLAETLDFIREVRPDSVPVTPPGVLPNTPWAEHPEQFGIGLADDYTRKMMEMKIKLLFPAILWKPLPYTIDGKDSREIVSRSAGFSQEIDRMGITTFMSDELKILARYSGMEPGEFRNRTQEYIMKGDYSAMDGVVREVNENVFGRVKGGDGRGMPC